MLPPVRLWLLMFGASSCNSVRQPASKGSLLSLSTLDVVEDPLQPQLLHHLLLTAQSCLSLLLYPVDMGWMDKCMIAGPARCHHTALWRVVGGMELCISVSVATLRCNVHFGTAGPRQDGLPP